MTDPAQIARGLSDRMKQLTRTAPWIGLATYATMKALRQRGIMCDFSADLTPLGLAVRAELEKMA